MVKLPIFILPVLIYFQHLFTKPVWEHAKLLLIGAILCTKQRTITAILRLLGRSEKKNYSTYYYVLNAARWSILKASYVLFLLLIKLIPKSQPISIVMDDTFERRRGPKIKWLGFFRDSTSSGSKNKICRFGLKWLCICVLIQFPWSQRKWALPFMIILTPPRKVLKSSKNPINKKIEIRRKTSVKYAAQAIKLIRRWIDDPKREIRLIADGAFCCFEVCGACKKVNATFICRLRWDACLYDFPSSSKKRGRPKKIGRRLPKLDQKLKTPIKYWKKGYLNWYGNIRKKVLYLTGTCIWYRKGNQLASIRWIIIKDPNKKFETSVLFSTKRSLKALSIAQAFIERWNIEVTFEETRAHLGFGTQRGWANKTIERTTPTIFGLFSIICLIAKDILQKNHQELPIKETAWYKKSQGTFSDVHSFVRWHLFSYLFLGRSSFYLDRDKNPMPEITDLLLECG